MKILVMSDLHLEFAQLQIRPVDADLVILAGDIWPSTKGIRWAQDAFDIPVLYVAGNHEFYSYMKTMDELLLDMHEACEDSNVHFLDRGTFEMNGVRFIGTTLWTDLLKNPFGGISCGVIDSDVGHIMTGDGEGLNDLFAQALFEKNRTWMKSELGKPFSGKTVVITHHAPSVGSLHSQYSGNPWNSCFVTNMEELMGDKIDLWVHGHTHNCFDYRVNGTRVVCNPRGYPHPFGGWENSEFNQEFIVEV